MKEFLELFEKALIEGKIVIKSEVIICRTSVSVNGNVVCVKDGNYSPLRNGSEYEL